MDPTESLIPTDPKYVTDRVRAVGGVPWRRLLRYLRPHAAPFSVAIVGLLIGSGLGLLVPLVIAGLVTEVVAGGDSAGLDRLIVGMLILFLAQSLGGLVQSYYLGVVGERIVAQLRGELFASLVNLSLDFHGRHRVGELVSRLSSDVTLIRTMLTQTTTSLLSSLIGLIGSVLILFTLSPTLLLVALLLAPALLAVAIVSWTWVDTRWSGRPNTIATASRAGASSSATRSSVGLSVNRMRTEPMSPMSDDRSDVVVWVSIVRIRVTSDDRRDTSSPTRCRPWKSSDSVTRLANSSARSCATIRSPTTPR